MTVIAWDGKTLAADKRGCRGGAFYSMTKVFRVGDSLVGIFGQADRTEEMLTWFRNGADPAKFPDKAEDDGRAWLLVIRPDGVIQQYETNPYPLTVEEKFFACGSGGDFATTAMHLGRTAEQAVEIACLFDETCGNGVDTLDFGT